MKTTIVLLLIGASALGQTNAYLDKNQVKARIFVCNDRFWNYGGNAAPSYEVPVGQSRHSMFANSMWIGGLDPGGQLHIAANTYKQMGRDFWSGPLDTTNINNFNNAYSSVYNKVWKVDCSDISAFVNAYNNGSVTAGTYSAPPGIAGYPGNGLLLFQRQLEPYFDANGNGVYDPVNDGDYPLIKGHQQILSIYNDQFATHTETGGEKMGIEVHERSFAFSEPGAPDSINAINFTTFYHYTIYNRSAVNYHDVYISDWDDVDVGYYMNDYIGTDTANGFAYCYNSGSFDPTVAGVNGYGSKPPVCSHALIATDCSSDGIDNDLDMQIDEPGEQFQMNKTTYFNNNIGTVIPATTNPYNAANYYGYMSGLWKDNQPFTYGGNARGGTSNSNWVYTGDPQFNTGWTESTAGNAPGDRRIIISSGPFNFPANSKIEWGYAIVFSQDTANINTISQYHRRVVRDVKQVRNYYAAHLLAQCSPSVDPTVGLSGAGLKLNAMMYPNPVDEKLIIDLTKNVADAIVTISDLLGRNVAAENIRNGYRAVVDVSRLEKGVYIVHVKSADRQYVEKVVKR